MSRKQPISTGPDWTFELLEQYDQEISRIAKEKFKLDTYPNQIEVIRSDQMMDAYASVGMPVSYHHWTYGKKFVSTEKNYSRGRMIFQTLFGRRIYFRMLGQPQVVVSAQV